MNLEMAVVGLFGLLVLGTWIFRARHRRSRSVTRSSDAGGFAPLILPHDSAPSHHQHFPGCGHSDTGGDSGSSGGDGGGGGGAD